MANLMDLIRQIQGQQQGMMQEGGGIASSPQQRILEQEQIEAGQVADDSGVYFPGIQVDGTVRRPATVDQSQYLLSAAGAPDLRNSEWAQAAVNAREENDKKVQHKGMFGVKGTLRNVLGVLGDAFLVQGGGDPVYAPTRQREREGDAMAGMTQAPRGAVERMTAVNPALAQDMGQRVAAQEIARQDAERLAQAELASRRQKGIGIVSSMLGAKGLEDKANYDRFKPEIQKFIDAYGLSDMYNLPDTYDPSYAATIASAGMTPYQQAQDDNTDERTALTAERNATLGAQGEARIAEQRRANQAREQISRGKGRSSSQPTEAAEIARIRGKVDSGTPLKPGEQATWKKYTEGTGGRTTRDGSKRPPVSTLRVRSVRDAN